MKLHYHSKGCMIALTREEERVLMHALHHRLRHTIPHSHGKVLRELFNALLEKHPIKGYVPIDVVKQCV